MNPIAGGLILIGLIVGVAAVSADVHRQRKLADFLQSNAPAKHRMTTRQPLPMVLTDPTVVVCILAVVGTGLLAAVLWRNAAATCLTMAVAGAVSISIRSKKRRIAREKLRTQFADGIASLASSMMAGNTFLRSLQQLERTAPEPLQHHLERVLNEVDLGEPVSLAVESMAQRTRLQEAAWLAHVLRVQELTGSPIAALLQELTGLVRQTDSLHREIRALTAEGRISAYVIAGLPLALVGILSVAHPGYLDPFTRGWGLVATFASIGAVGLGLVVMNLMVKSVEV